MEANRQRTTDLVDLIVKLALEEASPEVKTLVTHKFPDDDAWLCIWMAKSKWELGKETCKGPRA